MTTATADSLLEVAQLLTKRAGEESPGAASDAYARRAVSTAYYAVFHLLLEDLENEFSKTQWASMASAVVRRMDHDKLSKLARAMDTNTGKNKAAFEQLKKWSLWRSVLAGDKSNPDEDLRNFGRLVDELQFLRHEADYNRGNPFDVATATASVDSAAQVIALWRTKIAPGPVGPVFLLALMGIEGRQLSE